MEVLVVVGGFPVYGSYKGIIQSWGNKAVQERYGAIIFGIFHGKLDVGVYRVDVLEELVTIYHLLDDKGVIHISKPRPGRTGGRADGFGFKLFHETGLQLGA